MTEKQCKKDRIQSTEIQTGELGDRKIKHASLLSGMLVINLQNTHYEMAVAVTKNNQY